MAIPSDAFKGRVSERDYVEPIGVEVVPTLYIGGVPVAFDRVLVTSKRREQVFVFEGLTEQQANDKTAVTVTDASGISYTFTPDSSFTDGSTGSQTFEKEIVNVARQQTSPHLYTVVVTRVGGPLFVGSEKVIAGPSWYNPS